MCESDEEEGGRREDMREREEEEQRREGEVSVVQCSAHHPTHTHYFIFT